MELILSKDVAFGSEYHVAQPVWDEATYKPGWYNQEWNDMMGWVVSKFGPTPKDGVWTPNARWYANNARFWFREEKDILIFILRWS